MKAIETVGASSKLGNTLVGALMGSLALVGATVAPASASQDEIMPDGPLCPGYTYVLTIQEVIGDSPDLALFSRQIFQCEQERPGA